MENLSVEHDDILRLNRVLAENTTPIKRQQYIPRFTPQPVSDEALSKIGKYIIKMDEVEMKDNEQETAKVKPEQQLEQPPKQEIELTNKEKEVFKLLKGCFSRSEISDMLNMTLPCVYVHTKNICKKYGVPNLKELTRTIFLNTDIEKENEEIKADSKDEFEEAVKLLEMRAEQIKQDREEIITRFNARLFNIQNAIKKIRGEKCQNDFKSQY